ncbi:MAG: LPS-assembly protein LptD [Planctomycetota bacterium]|nr:LPS-assembly protein LptD [Planctomycetota bacterium]
MTALVGTGIGGEVPPEGGDREKNAAVPDEEITYSAAAYYRDAERGAYIFAGSAWVRFRSAKVEADNIVYFHGRGAVYAEGNVRLTEGESQTTCDVFFYDLKASRGYAINPEISAVSRPGKFASRLLRIGEPGGSESSSGAAPDSLLARTFRDPYGPYLDPRNDPQARVSLVMRAARIVQHGPLQFSAHDARLTVEEQAEPTVYARVRRMDYYLREMTDSPDTEKVRRELHRVVMRGITLMAGPLPVFWLPRLTLRTDGPSYYFSGNAGHSSRWGWFGMGRFGLEAPPIESWPVRPRRMYLDLDYRSERGVGSGVEVSYAAWDEGRGRLRVYGVCETDISEREKKMLSERQLRRDLAPLLDGRPRRSFDENILFEKRRLMDNAGPPKLFPERYPDGTRWAVEFQHHQGFDELSKFAGWNLDLKYSAVSDRQFLNEYERRAWKEGSAPEALAAITRISDDWRLELAWRADPLDFKATPPTSIFRGPFTWYEPMGRADLLPTHLGFGFFLDGTLSAGRFRREFDRRLIDQDGFDAGRLHLGLTLSRPVILGPVTFKPYVGTSQALYDDSRDGDAKHQGACTWGATLSTRICGTFDGVEVPVLGIRGLRHVVEPRIEYHAVSAPSSDPVRIYDFDDVDDIRKVSRISFVLDQRLRTRDPDGSRIRDHAMLAVSLDFLPDPEDRRRLLDGDRFDALRIDAAWNVLPWMRLDGEIRVDAENGKVERGKYGLRFDPGGRWIFGVQHRFAPSRPSRGFEGYDHLRAFVACQISERWRVRFEQTWRLSDSVLNPRGNESHRLVVDRDFGILEVSVSYRHSASDRDSVGFVEVRPRILKRNLILPTDRLLVHPSELAAGGIMGEEGMFGIIPVARAEERRREAARAPKGPLKHPPPPPGARLRGEPFIEHANDLDALPWE